MSRKVKILDDTEFTNDLVKDLREKKQIIISASATQLMKKYSPWAWYMLDEKNHKEPVMNIDTLLEAGQYVYQRIVRMPNTIKNIYTYKNIFEKSNILNIITPEPLKSYFTLLGLNSRLKQCFGRNQNLNEIFKLMDHKEIILDKKNPLFSIYSIMMQGFTVMDSVLKNTESIDKEISYLIEPNTHTNLDNIKELTDHVRKQGAKAGYLFGSYRNSKILRHGKKASDIDSIEFHDEISYKFFREHATNPKIVDDLTYVPIYVPSKSMDPFTFNDIKMCKNNQTTWFLNSGKIKIPSNEYSKRILSIMLATTLVSQASFLALPYSKSIKVSKKIPPIGKSRIRFAFENYRDIQTYDPTNDLPVPKFDKNSLKEGMSDKQILNLLIDSYIENTNLIVKYAKQKELI